MTPNIPYFAFLNAALFEASIEADATEALHFMHGSDIVHCDHKLPNILICRSGGPTEFVGKITDPGVWYGESGFRSEGKFFRKEEPSARKVPATSTHLLPSIERKLGTNC